MRKRVFCVLILNIFLLLLTGCGDNNTENLEVKKGISEVKFLENQCITIFTKYLSNEYSEKNGQINWKSIDEDYAVLDNSLEVILIDFASLKISSKNVVELENYFTDLNVFLKDKDIDNFFIKLCDTYNLISNSILSSLSDNEILKLEKKSKSDLLYIGYYLKENDKERALEYVNVLQDDIAKLNLNKEYIENNSYKVNRIFIYIQELKSLIDGDNFDLEKEIIFDLLDLF